MCISWALIPQKCVGSRPGPSWGAYSTPQNPLGGFDPQNPLGGFDGWENKGIWLSGYGTVYLLMSSCVPPLQCSSLD